MQLRSELLTQDEEYGFNMGGRHLRKKTIQLGDRIGSSELILQANGKQSHRKLRTHFAANKRQAFRGRAAYRETCPILAETDDTLPSSPPLTSPAH